MAINIMITDDHSMIREGLKNLLELDGDIKVIAEAENGEDCLEKLKTVTPDVLLLDINMPKMNGLEVLKKLKNMKSKIKVLVLTVHNETEYLMKAVDIGINGYVLKDSESAELKKAIFTIADGETYIQPSLIPALNSKMIEKNEDELKIDALTKRELEVLKEMAVGKFNRDIAKEMKIVRELLRIIFPASLRSLRLLIVLRLLFLLFVTTLFRLCNIFYVFKRGMFHVKHSSFIIQFSI